MFCPCSEYHKVTIILTGHSGCVEINVVLRVVEGYPRFLSEGVYLCNALVNCRRVSCQNYSSIDCGSPGTGGSSDSGVCVSNKAWTVTEEFLPLFKYWIIRPSNE